MMYKQIKDAVDRAISNIRSSMIGTITSVMKSKKEVHSKFSNDEEARDVKIASPYGFFSLPLNNQSGQIIFNNTGKSATLVGVIHENIPVELEPGEAVIFNESGTYILLRGGKVHIQGDVEINGNISYSGNLSKKG